MSLSSARSNVARTQSDLADLMKKDAALAKKEVDGTAKLNRASTALGKAKTPSQMSSKMRDVERAQKELAKVQADRAALAKKVADKRKEEHRCLDALSKEETRERNKEADAVAKLQKEQQRRQADLDARMKGTVRDLAASVVRFEQNRTEDVEHDVFISHATEDKASFVEGFAAELRDRGLEVWYDGFSLGWGDRLRQEIDRGLRSSKFGVVVLSKSFFEKDWPQEELEGLFQLEMAGSTRILPIWHSITKDEVQARSPMLAGRLGLNTALLSTSEIADQLKDMVEGTRSAS